MSDEFNLNEKNYLAKILAIRPEKYGSSPVIMNLQVAYDTRMSGGGTPDFFGNFYRDTNTHFEVTVHRFSAKLGNKLKIRAWRNMPLFRGDILETGANLSVLLELTNGGLVGIKTTALVQILEQEVQDLNYGNKDRLDRIIDKFIIDHNYDPLNVDFRSDDGIRG